MLAAAKSDAKTNEPERYKALMDVLKSPIGQPLRRWVLRSAAVNSIEAMLKGLATSSRAQTENAAELYAEALLKAQLFYEDNRGLVGRTPYVRPPFDTAGEGTKRGRNGRGFDPNKRRKEDYDTEPVPRNRRGATAVTRLDDDEYETHRRPAKILRGTLATTRDDEVAPMVEDDGSAEPMETEGRPLPGQDGGGDPDDDDDDDDPWDDKAIDPWGLEDNEDEEDEEDEDWVPVNGGGRARLSTKQFEVVEALRRWADRVHEARKLIRARSEKLQKELDAQLAVIATPESVSVPDVPYEASPQWALDPMNSGFVEIKGVAAAGIAEGFRLVKRCCPNLAALRNADPLKYSEDSMAVFAKLCASCMIITAATSPATFMPRDAILNAKQRIDECATELKELRYHPGSKKVVRRSSAAASFLPSLFI
jgi:hypothetical protein